MAAIFTFSDEGAGTRSVARCLHKDAARAKEHEDMGFFDGWGICITQIEDPSKTL